MNTRFFKSLILFFAFLFSPALQAKNLYIFFYIFDRSQGRYDLKAQADVNDVNIDDEAIQEKPLIEYLKEKIADKTIALTPSSNDAIEIDNTDNIHWSFRDPNDDWTAPNNLDNSELLNRKVKDMYDVANLINAYYVPPLPENTKVSIHIHQGTYGDLNVEISDPKIFTIGNLIKKYFEEKNITDQDRANFANFMIKKGERQFPRDKTILELTRKIDNPLNGNNNNLVLEEASASSHREKLDDGNNQNGENNGNQNNDDTDQDGNNDGNQNGEGSFLTSRTSLGIVVAGAFLAAVYTLRNKFFSKKNQPNL